MSTLILPPGFTIGHAADEDALTGCTVILCPPKTAASCDVRGNSPGSRELELLAPTRTMKEVHALLLTGGSAYGLGAADGIMRWLSSRGIGYKTPWQIVPIVPAAVVFDLNLGRNDVFPDSAMAIRACDAATTEVTTQGNVGAGIGTTVGKWLGPEFRMKGGFGAAANALGDLQMCVVAIVNAVGDIIDANGSVMAGAIHPDGAFAAMKDPSRILARNRILGMTNTTLVAAMMNGALTKLDLNRIAQRMHDGMARSVVPSHTSFDGDVTFALSSGTVNVSVDDAAEFAADLTSQAIRNAVLQAESVAGIPSARSIPRL